MFSNKPKDTATPAPATNLATAPAARRANGRPASAPSIISADLVVQGNLLSAGDIHIDGRVEGDVRSQGLVIGDKAEVHGEVWAEDLTIRGKLMGSIRARKVVLTATSHVEGDVLHEAFAVEAGAFFEGSCRHSSNPLGDEAPKLAVAAKTDAPQTASPFVPALVAQAT